MVRFLPSFGAGDESKAIRKYEQAPPEASAAQMRRASQGRGYVYEKQPYTPPGPDVDRMVKDGYEKVIWAFRAIDAIADKMSSWPIMAMEGFDPDWRQVKDEDALPLLNQYSNEIERSAKYFRYRLVSQLLLSKKGVFVEVIPTNGGKFSALNLLPPGFTSPLPDPNKFLGGFRVELPGGERIDLPVYDPEKRRGVLWIRKPHPTDTYSSVTPLEAAGISLDLDFYARLYNRNFLLNDGRAGQLVAVKGGLSDEDARELKARFTPGIGKAGQTTVIEADSVSVQDTAVTPRDAQYAELRNITKDDILIALGTPESVLGNASGRTFDNADAEKENWLDVTVLPLSSVVESGFDPLTKGGWGDDRSFAHDTSAEPVLRRRWQQKVDQARKDQLQGLITIDEFREIAEMKAIGRPGSRVLWVGSSKVAVGKDEEDEKAAGELKPVGAPPTGPLDGAGVDGDLGGFDAELDALTADQAAPTALAAVPDLEAAGWSDFDTKDLELEEKRFNPSQPRYPSNHPMGGQFMDTGDVALWLAGKPLKNGQSSAGVVDPNAGSTAAAVNQNLAGGPSTGGSARFLLHSNPTVRDAAATITYPSSYKHPRVLGAPPAQDLSGPKATKLVSLRKGDVVNYSGPAANGQPGPWSVAGAKRAAGGNVQLELVNGAGATATVTGGQQQTLSAIARTPHPTVVAQAKRDVTAAAQAMGAPSPATGPTPTVAAAAQAPIAAPPVAAPRATAGSPAPAVGQRGPFPGVVAPGTYTHLSGAQLVVTGPSSGRYLAGGQNTLVGPGGIQAHLQDPKQSLSWTYSSPSIQTPHVPAAAPAPAPVAAGNRPGHGPQTPVGVTVNLPPAGFYRSATYGTTHEVRADGSVWDTAGPTRMSNPTAIDDLVINGRLAATSPAGAQVPAPAPAPARAVPSASVPQFNLPTPVPGSIIYAHPQGKHIYVLPSGAVEVWKPDGKRGTTSATAAKLAAGHGAWTRVNAPATGPIPGKAGVQSPAQAAPQVPTPAPAAATAPTPTPAAVRPQTPTPQQATPAAAPAPSSAVAAAVIAKGVPTISVGSGWKVSGGQGGSNPAAQMTNGSGTKYYVKSQDAQHADNEVAAARIYAAAGVQVPEVSRATIAGGAFPGQTSQEGIASKVVAGTPDLAQRMQSNPAYRDRVLEDFAVHAWLGNWDAMENNNTMTDANGDPVTIDVGGSLLFRARGGSRKLDDKVAELQSMRNASAGGSARAAFAQLKPDHTDARFVAGVERIAAISPAQIKDLVDSSMPSVSTAKKKQLVEQLVKRREHLADEARVTLPEKRQAATPVSTPAAPPAAATVPAGTPNAAGQAGVPAGAPPVGAPAPAPAAGPVQGPAAPNPILVPPPGYPYPIVQGAPVATALKAPKPIKAASLRKGDVIQFMGGPATVISIDRSSGTATVQLPNGQNTKAASGSGSHLALARTPHPTVVAAARRGQTGTPMGPQPGTAPAVQKTTPAHTGTQAIQATAAFGAPQQGGYAPVPGQTYATTSGQVIAVHSDGSGTQYARGGASTDLTAAQVQIELDPGTAFVPVGPRILTPQQSLEVGRYVGGSGGGDTLDVLPDGSGVLVRASAPGPMNVTDAQVALLLGNRSLNFGLSGPSPAGLRTGSGVAAPTTAPAAAAAPPVPGAPAFVPIVGQHPSTLNGGFQSGQVFTNRKSGNTMTIDSNGQGTLVLGPKARGGTPGTKSWKQTAAAMKAQGWEATSGPDIDQPGPVHAATVRRALRNAAMPPVGTVVQGTPRAGAGAFPSSPATGVATSTTRTNIARGATVRVDGEDWIVMENLGGGLYGYRPGKDDPLAVRQLVSGGPWIQGHPIPNSSGNKLDVIAPAVAPVVGIPQHGLPRPFDPNGDAPTTTAGVGTTHGAPFSVTTQLVNADQLKAGDAILVNNREGEGLFIVTRVDVDRKGRQSVFGYSGTGADAAGTPGVEDKLFLTSPSNTMRQSRVAVANAPAPLPVIPDAVGPTPPSSIERNPISDATTMARINQVVGNRYGQGLGKAAGATAQGNQVLAHLQAMRGYHAHPDVISEAEMDQYVDDGEIEIFRGMTGTSHSNDLAEAFRSGEHYPGNGMFGAGAYAAYGTSQPGSSQFHSVRTGLAFARDQYASGQSGVVMRMTIKADARVAEHDELIAAMRRMAKTDPIVAKMHDVGHFAVYMGYDVIRKSGAYRPGSSGNKWDAGFVVLLNRSALRVSEKNYVPDNMLGSAPTGKNPPPLTKSQLKNRMDYKTASHDGDVDYVITKEP